MTVFQEMGIESKFTQQNSMILYHSLLRKMPHLIMKKYMTLLDRKVVKIRRSAFFGHPV